MKKLLCLFVAILGLFTFTSCGGGGSISPEKPDDGGDKTEIVKPEEGDLFNVYFLDGNGGILREFKIKAGDRLDPYMAGEPYKDGFKFVGWDYDFNEPVYQELKIKPIFEPVEQKEELYTISFNNAQFGALPDIEAKPNTKVELPRPKEEGYIFKGFEYEGVIYYDFLEFNFDHDITLNVIWEKKEEPKASINYHLDGGNNSMNNPESVKIGETIYLADPTKDGYRFDGWYLEPTFENMVTSIEVTESINLYAKFIRGFKLTYVLNGGTGYNQETIEPNELLWLNNVTKAGEFFAGWYDNPDFLGRPITYLENVTFDQTLYAKFVKEQLTITVRLNNGTDDTIVVPVSFNESFSINIPDRPGYVQTGLTYNGEDFLEANPYEYGESITVDVVWMGIHNQISYYMDYEGNTNPTEYITGEEIELKPLTDPAYRFMGWYLDSEFTKPITKIDSTMYGNITLYAKREHIVHTITYVIPEEFAGVENTNPTELQHGDYLNPSNLELKGYNFGGWFNEAGERVYHIEITKDITLTAKFNPRSFTVIYHDRDDYSYYIDIEYNQILNIPEIEHKGYNILGWKANDGRIVKDKEPYLYDEGLSIYPMLELIHYNITYVLDGGTLPIQYETTYTVESSIQLPTPHKVGTRFKGYSLASDDTTNVFNYIYGRDYARDLTLYACYSNVTATIHFSNLTETGVSDMEVVVGAPIVLPKAVAEGKVFLYWSADYNGKTKYDLKYYPDESDTYLYAVFAESEENKTRINYHLPEGSINHPNNPEFVEDYNLSEGLGYPTIPGYSLVGWYKDPELTIEFLNGKDDMVENLYPKLEGNSYEIQIRYNNKIENILFVTEGQEVELPTEMLPGYEVAGYKYNGKEFTGGIYNYPKDIIIDAILTPIKYTLTLNYDGGTTDMVLPTEFIASDIFVLPRPFKLGYEFIGWTDGTSYYKQVNGEIAKSLSLTAKYRIIEYKISYKFSEAISCNVTNNNPTTYTVNDEFEFSDIILSNQALKYEGLYLNGAKQAKLNKGTTGDLVYIVSLVPNIFTATVSIKKGSHAAEVYDTFTFAVGDHIDDHISIPKFVGYNLSKTIVNGKETHSIGLDAAKDTEIVYEYAPEQYRISYSIIVLTSYTSLEEFTHENPTAYTIEDEIILKPARARGGEFLYWRTNDGEIITKISGKAQYLNLQAIFVAEEYNVTIDYNDGTPQLIKKVAAGYCNDDAFIEPKRNGYKFLYYVVDGENIILNNQYYIESNITIKAVWDEIVKHTITLKDPAGDKTLYAYAGDIVRLPELESMNGEQFVGWSYNNGSEAVMLETEFKYLYTTDIVLTPVYRNASSDFEYTADQAGITLTKYLGTSKDVLIPDTINGQNVVALGANLFTSLDTLILGRFVERIDDNAIETINKRIVLNEIFEASKPFVRLSGKVRIDVYKNTPIKNMFNFNYATVYVAVHYGNEFKDKTINQGVLKDIDFNLNNLNVMLYGFTSLRTNEVNVFDHIYFMDNTTTSIADGAIDFISNLNSFNIHVVDLDAWVNVTKHQTFYYDLYLNDERVTKLEVKGSGALKAGSLVGLDIDEVVLPYTITSIENGAIGACDIRTLTILNPNLTSIGNDSLLHNVNFAGNSTQWNRAKAGNNYNINVLLNYGNEIISRNGIQYKLINKQYVEDIVITDTTSRIIDLSKELNGYTINSFKLNGLTRCKAEILILPDGADNFYNSDIYKFANVRIIIRHSLEKLGYEEYNKEFMTIYTDVNNITNATIEGFNGNEIFNFNNRRYLLNVKPGLLNYDLNSSALGTKLEGIVPNAFNNEVVNSLIIPGTINTIGYLGINRQNGINEVRINEGTKLIKTKAFNEILINNLYLPKGLEEIEYDGLFRVTKLHVDRLEDWVSFPGGKEIFNYISPNEGIYVNGELLTKLTLTNNLIIEEGKLAYLETLKEVEVLGAATIKKFNFEGVKLDLVSVNDLDLWLALDCCGRKSNPLGGLSDTGKFKLGNTYPTDITIPDGTTIKANAFEPNKQLNSLYLEGTAYINDSINGLGFKNLYVEDFNKYLLGNGGYDRDSDFINNPFLSGNVELLVKGSNGYEHIVDLVLPVNVTRINNSLFAGLATLRTVEILGSNVEIGNGAFENCENLVSFNALNGISTIGDNAFSGDYRVKKFDLIGTTRIGEYAFARTEGLISLPETVTYIGGGAFRQANIDRLIVNNSLEIEWNAFEYCAANEVIITNDINLDQLAYIDSLPNCENLIIGSGVSDIWYQLFDTFESIAHIESHSQAFATRGNDAAKTDLNGLFTSDLKQCFYALNNTIIPVECQSVLHGVKDCNLYYAGTNDELLKVNVEIYLKATMNMLSEHPVKHEVKDGIYYFSVDDTITAHIIDTMKPSYDFRGLSASVVSIRNYNCLINATKLYLPNNLSDDFEYRAVSNIVVLPENIKVIPEYAYSGSNITEITIPEGVTAIERGAFENCHNLKKVVLPSTLETIANEAFKGSGIEEIYIPSTLKEIGYDVFKDTNIKIVRTDNAKRYITIKSYSCPSNENTLLYENDKLVTALFAESSLDNKYVEMLYFDLMYSNEYNPNGYMNLEITANATVVENENYSYVLDNNKAYGLYIKSYNGGDLLDFNTLIPNMDIVDVYGGFENLRNIKVINFGKTKQCGDSFETPEFKLCNPDYIGKYYFDTAVEIVETANIRYIKNENKAYDVDIINDSLEYYAEGIEIGSDVEVVSYLDKTLSKYTNLKVVAIKNGFNLDYMEVAKQGIYCIFENNPDPFEYKNYIVTGKAVNSINMVNDVISYVDFGEVYYITGLVDKNINELDIREKFKLSVNKLLNIPDRLFKDAAINKLSISTENILNIGNNILEGATVKRLELSDDIIAKLGAFNNIDILKVYFDVNADTALIPSHLILGQGCVNVDLANSSKLTTIELETRVYIDNYECPNLKYVKGDYHDAENLLITNKNIIHADLNVWGSVSDYRNKAYYIETAVIKDISEFDLYPNLKVAIINKALNNNLLNYANRAGALVILSKEEPATEIAGADFLKEDLVAYERIKNDKYEYIVINNKYAYLIDVNDDLLEVDLAKDFTDLELRGIGRYAFEGSKATRIVLPNTVTSIAAHAFNNMAALDEVILSNGIINLPDRAFDSITINRLVMSPETKNINMAFYECDINELEFTEGLPTASTGDNLISLGNINANSIICDTNTVERIRYSHTKNLTVRGAEIYQTEGFYDLESLTLIDTVIIHTRAFPNSPNLHTINFPETLTTIMDYAFFVSRLTSLELPASLEEIGSYAFKEALISEVILPDSIKRLNGECIFPSSVTSVILPEGLEEFMQSAFDGVDTINVPSTVKVYDPAGKRLSVASFKSIDYVNSYQMPYADLYIFNPDAILGEELISRLNGCEYVKLDVTSVEKISNKQFEYILINEAEIYNLSVKKSGEKVIDLDKGLNYGVIKSFNYNLNWSEIIEEVYLPDDVSAFADIPVPRNILKLHLTSKEVLEANISNLKYWLSDYTRVYVGEKEITEFTLNDEILAEDTIYKLPFIKKLIIGENVRTIKTGAINSLPRGCEIEFMNGVEVIEKDSLGYTTFDFIKLPQSLRSFEQVDRFNRIYIPRSLKSLNYTGISKNVIIYYEGTLDEFMLMANTTSAPNVIPNITINSIEFVNNKDYSYTLINGTDAHEVDVDICGDVFKEEMLGEGIHVIGFKQYGIPGFVFKEFNLPAGLRYSLGDNQIRAEVLNLANLESFLATNISYTVDKTLLNGEPIRELNINNVDRLSGQIFGAFPDIKSVSLDNINTICQNVFKNISDREIIIGANVLNIEAGAFSGPMMGEPNFGDSKIIIKIAPENKRYTMMDTCLVDKNLKSLIYSTNNVVASGIEIIEDGSLDIGYLDVFIPKTVKKINYKNNPGGYSHIYYEGTEEEFNMIEGHEAFSSLEKKFNQPGLPS